MIYKNKNLSRNNNTQGDFFNLHSKRESNLNLPDGTYQGHIIKARNVPSKGLWVLTIEVEDQEDFFVTFIHYDVEKSIAWRDTIIEHDLRQTTDIEDRDIKFSIKNKEVGSNTYSNMQDIVLV